MKLNASTVLFWLSMPPKPGLGPKAASFATALVRPSLVIAAVEYVVPHFFVLFH